jgi:hypothetical protein
LLETINNRAINYWQWRKKLYAVFAGGGGGVILEGDLKESSEAVEWKYYKWRPRIDLRECLSLSHVKNGKHKFKPRNSFRPPCCHVGITNTHNTHDLKKKFRQCKVVKEAPSRYFWPPLNETGASQVCRYHSNCKRVWPTERHEDAWEGEEIELLLILDLGTKWGVSGQRHAPAALYPRYPRYRRLGGPHGRSGHRGQRKNPFASAGDRTLIARSSSP